MLRTNFKIVIIYLIISISVFSEIAVYEKGIIKQKCLLYADRTCKVIAGELYPNDEVKIVKILYEQDKKLFLVQIESPITKKGIILDSNFTENKIFPKKILFFDPSDSSLIYDFKLKDEFKKVEKGESFQVESESRTEDIRYIYYRTSLELILKINKNAKYTIE